MIKRGRGRPPGRGRPSTKQVLSQDESLNESHKDESKTETVDDSQQQTPAETPVKRGRGRPKKIPSDDSVKATKRIGETVTTDNETEKGNGVTEETSNPAPKKRGRKPKSEMVQIEKPKDNNDDVEVNQRKSQRNREIRTNRYSPEPQSASRKRSIIENDGVFPKKRILVDEKSAVETLTELKQLPSDDPKEMKFSTENGEEVVVTVPEEVLNREAEQIAEEIDEESVSKRKDKDPDYNPVDMEFDEDDDDDYDEKEDNENDKLPEAMPVTPIPKIQGAKMISTPIDSPKRGRGRPRKTPLPAEKNIVNISPIVSPPKKQPILTTVKSGKPLTTRPPVSSESSKLTTTPKKTVSTVRLTTTADPIPPRSTFSNLPLVQSQRNSLPHSNHSRFNIKGNKIPSLSRYMEVLPEISHCVPSNDYDVKEKLESLPDKIALISTELPFHLAEAVDFSDTLYLFRQAINSNIGELSKHICLLCKDQEMSYSTKEEKELEKHYSTMHELSVDFGTAKYSDEMVYICLPKSWMSQNDIIEFPNPDMKMNCQYCHPSVFPLSTIKQHYEMEHGKSVEFISQEDLNDQFVKFSCSECFHTSDDFDKHHLHMKTEHKAKTLKCKSCTFVCSEPMRMQTHFKAKHMLHNSGQNFQCNYCRGLLIGRERLNKHIQQSHFVPTGKDHSCIACRQVVPRSTPAYLHADTCGPANQGVMLEKCTKRYITNTPCPEPIEEDQHDCYFCYARINGKENYDKHLLHAHMVWVPDPMFVVDNEHAQKNLTIDDVITDEELAVAQVETFVGHWCRHCDIMIRCYQLYYLHMANHHKMIKVFQCIISECRLNFDNLESFIEHINCLEHSQKTIISHPDQVHVCVYCDLYFANKDKLVQHLISDAHINKFTNSGHFQRTEARNYKCKACFTMFGMKESYIHHLETESHQYVCSSCMVVTAQSAARRAHVQNAHHDAINQCDECGQQFQSDIDLTSHFVSHGFTFACPECPKKFYQREKLNGHMEVHQGEIVCRWEGCEKKIATTSMLVTHYRNHKSNHKCRFCNQAFWNENMLQSHMRSHRPALKQTRGGTMFRKEPQACAKVKECDYCETLLKTQREINSHRCPKMPVNKRMLDMVTKAAAEISPSTVSTISNSGKYTQHEPEETNQINENDTQVIMILNQNTGELMEITAPINMGVEDVIDAMQRNDGEFGASIEGTDVESLEVGPLKAVNANEIVGENEDSQMIIVPPSMVNQDGSIVLDSETIEQYNIKFGEDGNIVSNHTFAPLKSVDGNENSFVHMEAKTEKFSEVVIANTEGVFADGNMDVINAMQSNDGQFGASIVSADVQSLEVDPLKAVSENAIVGQNEIVGENDSQVIIVPASMVNQDGSIVLDSKTIELYNVKFGEDGNIISNHTFVLQSEDTVEEEVIEDVA